MGSDAGESVFEQLRSELDGWLKQAENLSANDRTTLASAIDYRIGLRGDGIRLFDTIVGCLEAAQLDTLPEQVADLRHRVQDGLAPP